jgi:hypothetical protein
MPVYVPVRRTAYGGSGFARTGRKKTREKQVDQREKKEKRRKEFIC